MTFKKQSQQELECQMLSSVIIQFDLFIKGVWCTH